VNAAWENPSHTIARVVADHIEALRLDAVDQAIVEHNARAVAE